MKRFLFALTALFAAAAFAAPQLPVDKAVTLANQHLKERGATGATYITSVKLEAGPRWAFTWSEPIAIDETKKETGIMIAMDGRLVSIVKGPPNKDPVTGKFDPNGPTGLQNPRTRTDRPSILDLKR